MVAHYYCEAGVRERLVASRTSRPSHAGSVPLLDAFFEPAVLKRLPKEDRPGMRFAPEVASFCFPHGVRLVTADEAAANAMPVVTSFVLTAADRSRMYGACIVWYEPLPPAVVQAYLDEQGGLVQAGVDEPGPESALAEPAELAAAAPAPPPLHAPEAICLLSRQPLFEFLNTCCRQLFRMRLSDVLSEQALLPLLSATVPPPGARRDVQLGNVSVAVRMPPPNDLPRTMAGRDFFLLFQHLDVSSVIILWALLLAEQKVVLQAKQTHVLTMAAETLSALLFPFSWQHVYIPILPANLLDILQAPVPYLIGIDEQMLQMAERQGMLPDDVVQVDLDSAAIVCDPDLAASIRLPQKQYNKLYKAIAPYCRPGGGSGQAFNAAWAFPMAPPPDVEADGSPGSIADMSDAEVASAGRKVKAAFLRFFVSLTVRYQELMILPPARLKQPAAVDFFDERRWLARFSAGCGGWLRMLVRSQAFTEWLEQRLAPPSVPDAETVFFNEQIDAKLMRSAKTKLFAKQDTPFLSTGALPPGGYVGQLVPPHVRTVYNASMIAARPAQAQQPVALLLVLGSGLAQTEQAEVADFEARLRLEFARHLLWSRVDVAAALRVHVCDWQSAGADQHRLYSGLEQLPIRQAMLDLTLYAAGAEYRGKLDAALRRSLRGIATGDEAAGELPLCVVAQGFGGVFVLDYLARAQGELPPAEAPPATPLERGETLTYLCTLSSPVPLLAASGAEAPAVSQLRVPTRGMVQRHPQVRGGWANFHHKGDPLGFPLQGCYPAVAQDNLLTGRHRRDQPLALTSLNDVSGFVRPLAQALSYVWQDINWRE